MLAGVMMFTLLLAAGCESSKKAVQCPTCHHYYHP
jgi:hypothetical protein